MQGNSHVKKLFLILFCTLSGFIWSQSTDNLRITESFNNKPVISVFNYLEQNYPIRFYYKDEWFARDTVTVRFSGHTLPEAVEMLLIRKPYTFRIINGNQVVFLPRADVALLSGQIPNYSSNGSEDQFSLVGSLSEAGKQKMASVTGKVTDGKTGEPVIGATIQIQNLQQGVVSNTYGEYKLMLTPGLYTLQVSSVGYETALFNVKIVSNGDFGIELFDKSVKFDDIVIYGQRLDRNVSSHQMSLVELNIREIGQLPSVSGGKDILKGLTIMPGVKSIGEFSSGINVRGGGEDQNLYLINSAPLFYTAHVFGLVSVINPDAVEKLSLYKGHIPSVFGERVSSVIDIRTRETPPEKFGVKGGIGLYDSRLMFIVPIVKDKIFLDFGGRTSYSGWLLKQTKDYDLSHSKASFYDLNGTLHVNLGKNRIGLSAYTSYDEFRFSSDIRYRYGSNIGSLNWNYLFNSSLASYLTLAYSEYDVDKDAISSTFKKSRINSGIRYGALKYRLQYGGIQKHNIEGGFSINQYTIRPGQRTPLNDRSIIEPFTVENEQAYEGAVFINDEFAISNSLILNIGLRYSLYANTGAGTVAQYAPGMPFDTVNITGYKTYDRGSVIRFYQGFEPRLSARIKLGNQSSVKMSFNRNIQYISMITYTAVSTPSDIWKLADTYVRPLIANQLAIGYYHNFFNNTMEASLEAYYKGLENVVDYKDGALLEMNENPETQLINTEGKNYGLEFMFKKNSGTIDGWITYTYSRSLRKTNGQFSSDIINNNEFYPSSYDRPHDFSIIANFHLNRRIVFSGNFSYSTGRPITLPENFYFQGLDEVAWFSEKNKYRIPPYHRLDLTITMNESLRLNKRWKGNWSFSVLNIYGRKNPYTIFYKMEEPSAANNYQKFNLYKLFLIGRPVPTLTYTFIF